MEVINAICVQPTIDDVVEYSLNAITANYIHADITKDSIYQVKSDVESVLGVLLSGFDICVNVSADNIGCLYDVSVYLENSEVYKARHIVEWIEL